MNIYKYTSAVAICMFLVSTAAWAQASLVEDQNPNYMTSQQKYMAMSDSITAWHGTTIQQTYKAIDFLADRREAKLQRQAFQRNLRLERARRRNYWYYGNNYYSPGLRGGFYNRNNNGYYNGYYNNNYAPYYPSYGGNRGFNNTFGSLGTFSIGLALGSYLFR